VVGAVAEPNLAANKQPTYNEPGVRPDAGSPPLACSSRLKLLPPWQPFWAL
jgi:hypothetical protein